MHGLSKTPNHFKILLTVKLPAVVCCLFVLLLHNDLYAVQMDVGPYVQFNSPHTAVVRWDTSSPADSIVEYGLSESTLDSRVHIPDSTAVHEVVLDDIHIKDKYFYRVGYTDGDQEQFTDVFWFDNNINYTRVDVSDAVSPYEVDSLTPLYEQSAEHILNQTGITKGICLVYGCGEGRLAFELAKRTDMMIIGVDTDTVKINTAAEKLMEAGLYGARVTVRHVTSFDNLPLTKYIANLIVSDHMIAFGQCVGSAEEMFRLLRPSGGVAYLGQPPDCPVPLIKGDLESWLDAAGLAYTLENDSSGLWAKVVRPDLAGAGWYSHMYAGAHNNGNSNDYLEGGTRTSDFDLQWISYPGADAKVDRQGRAQGPVAKNGRMVYRGFNRIITLDIYNGIILWSLEIPELKRFNIPRDSGWICIDDDDVYIAVKDDCWRLDANDGTRLLTHKLNDPGFHWGCVFRDADKLYGSAVKENSFFTVWWGSTGWYDATSGDQTYKICSDYIFANDTSGTRLWTYDSADSDKGVIINSTICLGGGRIYFVESRNSTVEAYSSGRIGLSELWSNQYLVALNADTGEVIYQQPINTADGIVVFYMMYAEETLLILSSGAYNYNLYAYNASSGASKWNKNASWPGSDNHGAHMQRPVVIGTSVYCPGIGLAYALSNGTQTNTSVPRGSCGTISGAGDTLLYRSGNITIWDSATRTSSQWSRIRSNCWINVIGAGGMVLAPEGGGGCDCYDGGFHTSVAFIRSDD